MVKDINDKIADLTPRLKKLEAVAKGNDLKKLILLSDKLTKYELAEIVKELKAQHEAYNKAIKGLNDASKYIGDANTKIKNVTKAIDLVAKGVGFVENFLKIV